MHETALCLGFDGRKYFPSLPSCCMTATAGGSATVSSESCVVGRKPFPSLPSCCMTATAGGSATVSSESCVVGRKPFPSLRSGCTTLTAGGSAIPSSYWIRPTVGCVHQQDSKYRSEV